MNTAHSKLSTEYYEPKRNEFCVCGSGKKFKKCCINKYSSESINLFKDAFQHHDYERALIHARYHFTWYALSHRAHTVTWLQRDPNSDSAKEILAIDIEALGEILDNIHRCYYKLGKTDEFQGVIERVKHSIDDPRWEIKLKYLLALWYAIDKNDELSSFKVLQEIDIAQCKDTDLLALYLQVSTNRIKFTESISIADRIIENTKKESYLLQYSLVKATFYFLSCQYEDAKEIIDKAVRNFRDLPADKQSSYGRLLFAYSLEFYGKSTHNSDLLFEAEQTTRQLISEYSDDEYTKDYIADLFKLLGDCELSQSKHIEAIKSYNASLEVKQSDLTKVFLVRALCGNNDLPEAKELLQSIQSEFLDDEGKFDLSVSWAIVAAISQASEDISKAKSLLKTASANHPIFSQQRDKLLIELLEIRPKSALGRFGQIIQTINKYIILNPNFFGIGINLNQIIDDTESKIPKKPR